MRLLSIGLISFALASSPAFAKKEKAEEEIPAKCGELQAHTVFLKDKAGNRQKGSAELISEQHKLAEKGGWNFDEMAIYIEDGDLQGFFITYSRPHPCND
jgi:hypothetical protein